MKLILTYKYKLSELFPPDDPASPWMLRLAILRDDLEHEFNQICAPNEKKDPAELWRAMYSARKICVTLEEIRNVFAAPPARDYVRGKRVADTVPAEPLFDLALGAIADASAELKPVRDALGAHVRPSNAMKGPGDPTPHILRAHGESDIEVRLDPLFASDTNLHDLNAASVVFAWPDVVTDADAEVRIQGLIDKLTQAYIAATKAIDGLLFLFWPKPTETDFGL